MLEKILHGPEYIWSCTDGIDSNLRQFDMAIL